MIYRCNHKIIKLRLNSLTLPVSNVVFVNERLFTNRVFWQIALQNAIEQNREGGESGVVKGQVNPVVQGQLRKTAPKLIQQLRQDVNQILTKKSVQVALTRIIYLVEKILNQSSKSVVEHSTVE